MKENIKNAFILDLSNSKDNSQLVAELSALMENPEVKGKNICLKIGNLDLSQAQLLSIKALVESMDADIVSVTTTSEQTQASVTSLGLNFSEYSNEIDIDELDTINTNTESNNDESCIEELAKADEETQTINVDADTEENNPIETVVNTEDVFEEETMQELSEIIPSENFETDFEHLALSEGLLPPEETSKYILLDTGDILNMDLEKAKVNTETLPTLYVNQNLRSGQTISYEGNVFIIGDAHPGSEIVADGDITVWGILGGIAHAGQNGNITAKVRALKLNAIQLRIANMYARRNDTLNVPYVQKTNEFTPEEAQIVDERIVIYKKLRRN